jgi:hypothetical protein
MVKKQLDHPIREIHTLPNFDPEQNWNLIQNLMVFARVKPYMEPHFPRNQRVNIQKIDVAYHEDSKCSAKNKCCICIQGIILP